MGTREVRLADVSHGARGSRLRLLAPIRYLFIHHEEKTRYDFLVPCAVGLAAWGVYLWLFPRVPIFGPDGLLKFARDLLVMSVPFMIGALAAVSMGSPGQHLDRRPVGAELYLDGQSLTLRQFVCYLLGYLSFLSLAVLVFVVAADLVRPTVVTWLPSGSVWAMAVHHAGTFALSQMLSFLSVTVLWALYFLTVIVNRVD